jgi:hypothetical protein
LWDAPSFKLGSCIPRLFNLGSVLSLLFLKSTTCGLCLFLKLRLLCLESPLHFLFRLSLVVCLLYPKPPLHLPMVFIALFR